MGRIPTLAAVLIKWAVHNSKAIPAIQRICLRNEYNPGNFCCNHTIFLAGSHTFNLNRKLIKCLKIRMRLSTLKRGGSMLRKLCSVALFGSLYSSQWAMWTSSRRWIRASPGRTTYPVHHSTHSFRDWPWSSLSFTLATSHWLHTRACSRALWRRWRSPTNSAWSWQ